MAELVFNNLGIPLLGYGTSFQMQTVGIPETTKKSLAKPEPEVDDSTTLGSTEFVNWGSGNDFPGEALKTIRKTGVLNAGLKFMRNFTLGQGIFPCRVTGYNTDGSEILEVVSDPDLTRLLNSRMVRRYLANSARDIFKFGRAFPQLLPNEDGSRLVGINTVNAQYSRVSKKERGIIKKVAVSGDFPDSPSAGNYTLYDMLDDYDPLWDLQARRIDKKISGKSFIYPLRDEWDNNEYYPLPVWYSAKEAGWIDIANQVPAFLKKMYENQITVKWHIRIPYAYWDKMYPKTEFKDITERRKLIQAEMDKIEETLTGAEGANKAVFSGFELGASGKAEEKWEIEALDNKNNADDKLITSSAANSEILFALMINPNVFGAGMPGGTYAGNQGGSNIREAFLVNVAMAWLDRQTFLDPLECMLEYNGITDVQLRFRNTILTTLDSGGGTKKVIS